MSFQKALAKLENQKILPLYLLVGDEKYLRRVFVAKLRDELDISENSLNYQRFEGEDARADSVLNACNMMTFDRSRRLIVASDPPVLSNSNKEEEERWLSYLADPSESSCLCVVADKVDRRRKFHRVFKDSDAGEIVDCQALKGRELQGWIQGRIKAADKKISREALRTLASTEASMDMLYNEIKKLILYVGDREKIDVDDVSELTSIPSQVGIFTMLDAIGMGKAKNALKVAQSMISQGSAPLMLLSMIARQIRLIWQVKDMQLQGKSWKQIAKEMKQPHFVVRKCAQQANNFSNRELERSLELILDADVGIKKGHWKPEMAVERLIAILSNSELRWTKTSSGQRG